MGCASSKKQVNEVAIAAPVPGTSPNRRGSLKRESSYNADDLHSPGRSNSGLSVSSPGRVSFAAGDGLPTKQAGGAGTDKNDGSAATNDIKLELAEVPRKLVAETLVRANSDPRTKRRGSQLGAAELGRLERCTASLHGSRGLKAGRRSMIDNHRAASSAMTSRAVASPRSNGHTGDGAGAGAPDADASAAPPQPPGNEAPARAPPTGWVRFEPAPDRGLSSADREANKVRLRAALEAHFMFSGFSAEQLTDAVNAMRRARG